MREIKFRAWDGKRMIDPVFWVRESGFLDFHDGFIYSDIAVGKKNGYDLMQYTGLKDRNGTEICEGDIMAYRREDGTFVNHSSLHFGPCGGGGPDESFATVGFYHLSKYGDGGLNELTFGGYEVVGNVYANPDLLG